MRKRLRAYDVAMLQLGKTQGSEAATTGDYDGPYNPWLEHFHRLGSHALKLMALTVALQRDVLHVYRDLGKMYGEPKFLHTVRGVGYTARLE